MIVGLAVVVACVLTLATMGRATTVLVLVMLASYGLWLTRPAWPGPDRIMRYYAIAVLVQCAHLVEEFRGGFHRVFPPVFGGDPWSPRQFLIFNLVWLVVFALAGIGLVRNHRAAYLVALFLAIGGGIANGLGHLALSAREGRYFPGAYTGALALLVGSVLAYRLLQRPIKVRL